MGRETDTLREIQNLQQVVARLEKRLSALEEGLEELHKRMEGFSHRYVVTCPACKTEFDMLAHHYSIGLFSNLVYVKCPKCFKQMPLQGGAGGTVQVVEE